MAHTYVYKTPVAFTVPYDPDHDLDCELVSENVQEALDELCKSAQVSASPGYAYGRSGSHGNNTWLIAQEVSSNSRGMPFGMIDGFIRKVTVANRNTPDPFTIEVRYHDGNLSGNTLIGSVTTAGTGTTEDFVVNWSVPPGHQIAVKITSVGNPKPQDTGVYLVIKGTLV